MVLKAGIIGCGNISDIYLINSRRFRQFDIVACADLFNEKAEQTARKYGIEHLAVSELLASEQIDLIINLTVPGAHADVSLEAVRRGKHVYSEKPLAISLEDGQKLLAEAEQRGVQVGIAPDTFLGGSIQSAAEMIAEGSLGRLVGASAFMMSRGPESWHPNPAFLYQTGAGPMYDMGPYYLTALVHLFGPVKRLTGSVAITFKERLITAPERYGETIKVQVPTHISGILDFAGGGSATITTSFDVVSARTPFLEIYLEHGTISLPDPNHFNLPLLVKRQGEENWREIQPPGDKNDNMRGIGICALAEAIEAGRKSQVDASIGLHVLEIMHGIHQSSEAGCHYHMQSTCQLPPAAGGNQRKIG